MPKNKTQHPAPEPVCSDVSPWGESCQRTMGHDGKHNSSGRSWD